MSKSRGFRPIGRSWPGEMSQHRREEPERGQGVVGKDHEPKPASAGKHFSRHEWFEVKW